MSEKLKKALQITPKGLEHLNGDETRKILLEKFKELNDIEVVFKEIGDQMLFILDMMKDGRKMFRSEFCEIEKGWKLEEGTSTITIMIGYEFLQAVDYP